MTDAAKPEQTPVNGSGTNASADTGLTHEGSRPVRYELIDKDGVVRPGGYGSAASAAVAARYLWPDQEQDPDRTGRGWDIAVIS